MGLIVRCVSAIQKYRRILITVVLTRTTTAGSGSLIVGDHFLLTGLDSDTPEAQAAENIDATVDESTTGTTLLVPRDWSGANTSLSKSALFESLER